MEQKTDLQKLIELQNGLVSLGKDAEADAGKYKYKFVSLPKIRQAIQPYLNKFGWILIQPIIYQNDKQYLVTRIINAENEKIILETEIEIQEKASVINIQKFGALITYLRRYSLVTLLGLTTEEDDDAYTTPEQAKEILSTMNSLEEIAKYFYMFDKKRQVEDKELIAAFTERREQLEKLNKKAEELNKKVLNEAIIE